MVAMTMVRILKYIDFKGENMLDTDLGPVSGFDTVLLYDLKYFTCLCFAFPLNSLTI